MKDFDKLWHESAQQPETLRKEIPDDARKRISNKIFGDKKKMFMPTWLSHAAAVLAGFILSLIFYYNSEKNTEPDLPAWASQQPLSVSPVHDAPPGADTGQQVKPVADRQDIAVKERRVTKTQVRPALNTVSPSPDDRDKAESYATTDVPAGPQDVDMVEKMPHITIEEEPDQPVAQKRRVVAVSDISRVSNNKNLAERIVSRYMQPSSAPSSDKSPFNFLNQ